MAPSRKPLAFAFLLLLVYGAVALAQPGAALADQAQGATLVPGAFAFACVCVGIATLIDIGVKIAILVFVFRDAKARGTEPIMWLVLCFFTDLIGLIIWLIVRPPTGGEPRV